MTKGKSKMRFLSKFFKRWYLYMVPLIVIPIVVTMYAKNTLSVYESTALLYVTNPTNGASGFNAYLSPAQNGANVMLEALQIESFCVSVAKSTDLASTYQLDAQWGQDAATARIQSEVTVTPTAVGQNLVTIAVDDKSPQMAQQIAAAVITQFSTYFSKTQLIFDQQNLSLYQGQLQGAQSKLQQDQTRLKQYLDIHPEDVQNPSAATTDPTLNSYNEAVTQDQQAVSELSAKINAIQLEEDSLSGGSSFFIVSDAPRVPLRTTLHLKKLIVYPIGGLAGALALIALIVGIQTFLDKRVYSTQDLKSIVEDMDLNIPAIESIPVLRGIGQRTSQDTDMDGSVNGVLVPVLTVLPHLGNGHMNQELRRAIGVTVEDEE